MSRQKRTTPAGGPGSRGAIEGLRALHRKSETTTTRAERKGWASPNLPLNWRDRLPDPATYYGHALDKLTRANSAGYAQARCPFHEDGNASLSVNLAGKGGWKCFAGCGAGDLVSFHQRRSGLDFKAAVLELVRGGRA